MPSVNCPHPNIQDKFNQYSTHLGNVLSMLADLDDGDRCESFVQALDFYNRENSDAQIEAIEGYKTFWFMKPLLVERSRITIYE